MLVLIMGCTPYNLRRTLQFNTLTRMSLTYPTPLPATDVRVRTGLLRSNAFVANVGT